MVPDLVVLDVLECYSIEPLHFGMQIRGKDLQGLGAVEP